MQVETIRIDEIFNERESTAIDVKSRMVEERGIVADTLCAKCKYGHVYRRRGKLEVVVVCRSISMVVPADIAECSKYSNPQAISMYEMEQLAIPIDKRVGVQDGSYA